MAIFSADIKGLDELIKDFAKLGNEAMPYVKSAADRSGKIILEKAKQKVPVDSGMAKDALILRKQRVKMNKYTLYHSVTYRGTKKFDDISAAHHITPLELGHKMVLFGTRTGKKVKARPFLRPAADESREEVARIMTEEFDKALKDFGRK